MFSDSAKCKEEPENEEQEMELEDRTSAMHKLPQTLPFPFTEARAKAHKREAALALEEPVAKYGRIQTDTTEKSTENDNVPTQSKDPNPVAEDSTETELTAEEIEELLASPENVIEELWVTPEQMLEDWVHDTPEVSPETNREYDETVLPFSRRFDEDFKLPRQVDDRYLVELKAMLCLEPSAFEDTMFKTRFGRMVLMVRPWEHKLWNLNTSFTLCRIPFDYDYDKERGLMRLFVKDILFAQATGSTKKIAKNNVAILAWDVLQLDTITVFIKPMAIAYDQIVTVNDLISRPNEVYSKWFRASTPTNLGADWQGIVEPIRPNVRVVIRRGVRNPDFTMEKWRAAFITLMERYLIADTIDIDLIFNSDFTDVERAMMYWNAHRLGLVTRLIESNGYSSLLVKRRLDPFTTARRVIAKGGDTPKYQVFLPTGVRKV